MIRHELMMVLPRRGASRSKDLIALYATSCSISGLLRSRRILRSAEPPKVGKEQHSASGSDRAALRQQSVGDDEEANLDTGEPLQSGKETLFGMPQSPSSTPSNVNPNYTDDYETRFPPDPIYQEASGNARVYRVFLEESAKFDASMTDEAREGLDVLLVFAGLFSAVLSTLVAQTSQSLEPDRATETTLLLREIAALQRAQINGTSINSIPPTPADFTPSSIDIWVNGLWFTSLTLHLVSASLAVLIKQWIRHYMSFVSDTARERSVLRQYRFIGLQKWHVPTLISVLPVLMHLSLAIFLAGLTLFLVALRPSIASVVGGFSLLVFVAYLATAIWPLFDTQCPYHTPFTNIIHFLFFLVRKYVFRNSRLEYVTLQDTEHRFGDGLVAHAFEWLLSISSNPSVHRVVAQAVGGLSRESSSVLDLLFSQNSNFSLHRAYDDMLADCFSQSPTGPRISAEKADLLERLFRTSLHTRELAAFSPPLLDQSDVHAAIQSFPAPTLQWEVTATVFLWHHYRFSADLADFCTIVTEKACVLLGRLMSKPRGDDIQLPVAVWENLLEAAASCPKISIPDRPANLMHDKIISKELERRVCQAEWSRSTLYADRTLPISFEEAVCTSDNFVWSLLWPFDSHRENPLDSKRVQRLLSLVNAFSSHGPSEDSRNIFFGTWKEIICEVQAGSVSLKDQEAICVAADTFLQQRTAFQAMFGPNAVLLPSLPFLYCWTPHTTSRSARNGVILALVEIDMFKAINELESIGGWLWSALYSIRAANNAAPVASLIASVIRTSLESRTSPPEDSRWLEYLSLPENSPAIVSMFTLQGSTKTPASVAQVRDDLVLFFASRSWDYEILQKCRGSLDWYLKHFFPTHYWRDVYTPNVKEARRVIDELISKQQSQPSNAVSRLLGRSRKTEDAEAR